MNLHKYIVIIKKFQSQCTMFGPRWNVFVSGLLLMSSSALIDSNIHCGYSSRNMIYWGGDYGCLRALVNAARTTVQVFLTNCHLAALE